MGAFDDIKAQIGKHADEVGRVIDQAGDAVDQRTGGKFAGQVDQAQNFAKQKLGANAEQAEPEAVLDPAADPAEDPVEAAVPAQAEPEHSFTEGTDEADPGESHPAA